MMDMNEIYLPDFCRRERKVRDMSQAELAEASGITPYRVFSLEAGKGMVTITEAVEILRALGYRSRINNMAMTLENIASEVKARRAYMDKTQTELAEIAGVSKSTVVKMERWKPVLFENAQSVFLAAGLHPTVEERVKPRLGGDLSTLCRQIRAEQRISQRELAERADVCWQTVQQFEHGDVYPRIDNVEAIFKSLGYEITIQKAAGNERIS